MAIDPARSLRAPRAPRVPETIRSGQARLTLAPDGGAIWFLTRRIGLARAKELVETMAATRDDDCALVLIWRR